MLTRQTIVALASGQGRAGVAILRVSGPQAMSLVESLCGSVPLPRRARLCTLRAPDGTILDRALVLTFRAPHSFTGEDVAEFHVHGGPAVIEAVLGACLAFEGLRLAAPGEFTRRGFENGKMDLSQAEGLGDLIDAETEAQRRQALRQMDGELRNEVEAWRDSLLDALVLAEGDIDFPDEDLPPGLSQSAVQQLSGLQARLHRHLKASAAAVRVRDGYRVAIIGPPNAGKSSLLNVLARRDAAMVSDIPGTTRDVVEVRLVLGGAVIWLADTAGLRMSEDQLEAEGIRRAVLRAQEADLRLALVSSKEDVAASLGHMQPGDIWVRSKSDLIEAGQDVDVPGEMLPISSKTGEGIDALEFAISQRARLDIDASDTGVLTRLRHREAVEQALACLDRALGVHQGAVELVAEDLRLAIRVLERICGRVDMEDVLDRIFSKFCIGK